ncbi:transposase [Pseudonocardia sp. N23]|uniref:IS110 family transposase n=1 Tax=Pseudonocardia sp. N23 TaxID=1987376 RepID=UPI000C02454A|nr:transposase [Pseudonocardia sp. N23]GAY08096.1 mobile element protein [Pseudonocardia sp. N23]
MPMLAEMVELVIGVDTHAETHTAALVAIGSRAVLATATVTADEDGYTELVALAEHHGGLRGWAIEGTGGYGAGLARHLAEREELVIELDRPVRPARRAGAKSDVIDAERAARDALSRTRLAQPKTGPDRAALQSSSALDGLRSQQPRPGNDNSARWSSPPRNRSEPGSAASPPKR